MEIPAKRCVPFNGHLVGRSSSLIEGGLQGEGATCDEVSHWRCAMTLRRLPCDDDSEWRLWSANCFPFRLESPS
jgi:hypothetical protein